MDHLLSLVPDISAHADPWSRAPFGAPVPEPVWVDRDTSGYGPVMTNDHTEPTGNEDEVDADMGDKDPGSMPTAEEEAAAERAAEKSPDIEEPYRDMTEKGAHAEGEGKID